MCYLRTLDLIIVDIYESYYNIDILVTETEELSTLLMIAINKGKPIISKKWID
jgi:hypothetical protein